MAEISPSLMAALSNWYRIERELGQGGMATVYLAQDLKHDRKVALKVLKPELAAVIGADRFIVEIRTTAALQHPHILPLFDSGTAGGFLFYVMPFIEGETLRTKLDREHQLSVEESVKITTEVADALDYAHRHGVIHRDIKPENILLHDGRPVVADFGIALALSAAAGGRMTETGMSLGTPHYMSPEQATAEKELTGRSDIYSLASVLYEMLAGDPPHTGATAQQIIMKIVTDTARPITELRRSVPPNVAWALAKALEKLPADRFATAKEFSEALSRSATPGVGMSAAPLAPEDRTLSIAAVRRRRWGGRVLAGVSVLATIVAIWGWSRGRGKSVTTWQYVTFGDSAIVTTGSAGLALSPDGTTIVIREGRQNGRLWVKRGSVLDPTPLPGTERAQNPTFSPDGEWVAFTGDQTLRKVRLATGSIVTLADSVSPSFGGDAWLDDGSIIYSSLDLARLMRVPAGGGPAVKVLDNAELQGSGLMYPTPLPKGRGVLFISCTSGCATMALRVLDLRTGKQHLLMNEAGQSWYLPTGHLLYTRRDGTTLVAPFDLTTLQITGAGIPVLTQVFATLGFTQLAWSPTGTIVYASGIGLGNDGTIVRVSRSGVATPIDPNWTGPLLSTAMSPDGKRLAVGVGGGTGVLNVWIKQLDHGPFTRLSFGGADRRPIWSPDGRMVAFIRDTLGTSVVMGRFADGSHPDTILMRSVRQIQEVDWSRDGAWLVGRTDNSVAGAGDLIGHRTGGDTTVVTLVASPYTELHPVISPDSHWLAYTSNESGRNEIYVRPFPDTNDGRWQVSAAGGIEPRWSRDGTELYFIDPGNRLLAAKVVTRPAFAVTGTSALFDVSGLTIDAFHTSYDLSADGKSFIFGAPQQRTGTAGPVRIIRGEHWFDDLRTRLTE